MTTLADLQRRILIVHHKERRTVLVAGGCKVILCLAGVLLGYFLVDWLFDPPYFARLFAAGLGFGLSAYAVNKHLLRELRKTIDDDALALRMEACHRELHGRLISTLQLSRAGRQGAYVGSVELVQALEEETLHMAGPLDFLQVVNTAALKRFGLIAALVLVLKLILVLRFPRLSHRAGRTAGKRRGAVPGQNQNHQGGRAGLCGAGRRYKCQSDSRQNFRHSRATRRLLFPQPGRQRSLRGVGGLRRSAGIQRQIDQGH